MRQKSISALASLAFRMGLLFVFLLSGHISLKEVHPEQREGSGVARPVLGQQVPAFPRDGHGQTNEKPFSYLPIFVCHCSLGEGLRRPSGAGSSRKNSILAQWPGRRFLLLLLHHQHPPLVGLHLVRGVPRPLLDPGLGPLSGRTSLASTGRAAT